MSDDAATLRARLKTAEDAISAAQEREDKLLGEAVDLQSEIRAKTLTCDQFKVRVLFISGHHL